MKRFLTLNALITVILLLFITPIAAQDDDATAYMRIAHFAADAPAVDLYIDGEISAVQNAEYGDVSDWYTIPEGTYEFAIVLAGESPDSAVIGPVELTLEADTWTTAAAIGLAGNEALELAALVEDYSPLSFGETRINAFHAIPDLGPVDVLANGETLFGLLAYPGTLDTPEAGDNDGFDTVTLAEGTFDVRIVDNANPSEVLINIGEFTFTAQRNYLVAATGVAATPTFRLISTVVDDLDDVAEGDIRMPPNADATEGFVRVAHLSSGTPAVDVYIDGELTSIQGLEFPQITDFVELPVGSYDVAVTAAGEPLESAVLTFELDVEGGAYLTAAAIGILANDTLDAQVIEEDFSPVDPGLVRITLFHAFPGLGPVDLLRDDGLEAIRFIDFPSAQGDNDGYFSVDLLAGTYDFSIVSAVDPNNVIAEVTGLTYQNGSNYFIAVINGENNFTITSAEVPTE
ncbi:MAG: DUF4397 domain-containing protein [Chloroflexota bacterium]